MGNRQTPPGIRNGQQVQTAEPGGTQYGERQQMEQGLRAAPLPSGQGQPQPGQSTPAPPVSLPDVGSGAALPPFMFNPTDRPAEPISTGMDQVNFQDPNDAIRYETLQRLATVYGNQDVADMLTEMRATAQARNAQAQSVTEPPGLGASALDVAPPPESPLPQQDTTSPNTPVNEPSDFTPSDTAPPDTAPPPAEPAPTPAPAAP